MTKHAPPVSGAYGLRVEDLNQQVTARFACETVARSTRARVMFETRLPPAIYLPFEDITATLEGPTDLQTFCPFKGTARYYDLILPDRRLKNAVWTYGDALPESARIEGYAGFMPSSGVEVDLGDNRPEIPLAGHVSGPMVDWLLRSAWTCESPEALVQALAEKLVENGVAISRLGIMIWSLHPLIAGKYYIWHKESGAVDSFAPSYEIYDSPQFVNSPLRHVSAGLGGVRQRIDPDGDDSHAFPIIADLRAEGATDYVAMPLPFSDGQKNVMTLTSDHPDGFTTANLGLIFECSPVISRYFEVFNQSENARTMLETYVGTRAGARVLGGEIRRGDGEEIDAAIMFCDMRASTRLEEELGREAYLGLLNRFFETVADKVMARGGEVLKFIGDAVLAVFPADEGCEAACALAAAAARDISAAMAALAEEERGGGEILACACATGLAYGQVMYGNVGSPGRLDFTVIGQAANVAARLGDHAKTLGAEILASGDFSAVAGAHAAGPVSLRNVGAPVESYVLDL